MKYKIIDTKAYEKGKKPKNGYVIVDKDGKVASKVYTNKMEAESKMRGMD